MVSESSYKRGKGDIQKKKLKKEEVFKVVKKIGERYLSFLSCSHWLKLFLLDPPPSSMKLLMWGVLFF